MIEGLKCVVTADELRSHLLKQADYHEGRKQDALEQLDVIAERLSRSSGWLSQVSGVPAERIEELIDKGTSDVQHKEVQQCVLLARAFRFIADHLADDNYLLSVGTMTDMGFFDPLPDECEQAEREVDQVQISPDQPRQQNQAASAPQEQGAQASPT